MTIRSFIPVATIVRKELIRTFRVPFQALGQPVVSTLLYFVVFGSAIGNRVGEIHGLSYTEFIMPGLVMLNVLTVAFFSVASALVLSKITNTLSDILVSPMSYFEIVAGYTVSAVVRSMIVALLIFFTALFFVSFHIAHPAFLILFTMLVAASFGLFGLLAGVTARNFEQVSVIPTFLIMPLAFLGGIFYSIEMLPPLARTLSSFNPFFYIMNGMRYGFYDVSDVHPGAAMFMVAMLMFILGAACWIVFRTGYKVKH